MKTFISLILATATLAHMPLLQAATYKLSGKSYVLTWPNGNWDGKFSIPNLFCLSFPNPTDANELTQAAFNNNSLYITRVSYKENLVAAIGISTRPPTRAAEDDINLFLEHYKKESSTAKDDGLIYDVIEFSTDFGKTIGLRFNNIISDTAETGPFPFERRLFKSESNNVKSMSVHRFFERGPDRYEIGVMQVLSQPISISNDNELNSKLTTIADEIVHSFQQCTSAIPVRKFK